MKYLIDQSALNKSDQKYLPRFQKYAEAILKNLGFKSAALSLIWVRDKEMARLNWKLMRHRGTTDVLSFSYLETKGKVRLTRKVLDAHPPVFLGEVIVCLDTAKRNALEHKTSLDYECALYVCHGILHCLGYDDQTRKQFLEMQKKQTVILKKVFSSRKAA